MRTTISHGDTKALARANGNVCTPVGGSLEKGESEKVSGANDEGVDGVG